MRTLKLLGMAIMAAFVLLSCQQDEMITPQGNDNEALPLVTAIPIVIQVSPNVLNILSNGTVVTIHTDIAYSQVVGATVSLNGLPISWWKADNQGNFVAKFNLDDVKSYLLTNFQIPTNVTLTLEGYTVNNETFVGSESILVLENTPAGSSRH